MDKKKGFVGYFTTAFTERLKTRESFGVKDAFRTVRESGTQAVAETAADMAITQTEEIVEQIKEDSAEIIKETAQKLSPEVQDSWQLIREQVAPQGGFFKTIFARLLWIGAKVSSFIGATVVDQWTGRNEKGQNIQNIDTIVGWLLGWIFKSSQSTNHGRQSPLISRVPGIPESWLSNAPIPT